MRGGQKPPLFTVSLRKTFMSKYYCMATGKYNKGVVTRESCLQCARDNFPPPCGFDFALLSRLLQSDRWNPLEVHVSDIISDCLRKTWLSKQGYEVDYPHNYLVVMHGSAVHAYIEGMAKDDEFYTAELNVSAKINGVDVLGTVDTIYHRPDNHVIIVDNKTTRNIQKKKLPKKEHVLQVSIYKYLLEQSTDYIVDECYISYIDLVGPSMCSRCHSYAIMSETGVICSSCGKPIDKGGHVGTELHLCETIDSDEIRQYLESRVKDIDTALHSDVMPEASPSFLCRYCPFCDSSLCPEGVETLF